MLVLDKLLVDVVGLYALCTKPFEKIIPSSETRIQRIKCAVQKTHRRERSVTNSLWNCAEKSAMCRPAFSPTTIICRKWDSEATCILNPFSSRHCFWQTWQYHRRRCRPFDFILLATHFGVPTTIHQAYSSDSEKKLRERTFSTRHSGKSSQSVSG